MSTEKLPAEPVTGAGQQDHRCSNCRHSIPSPISARVWCFVTEENKPLADSCCRWQCRE